MPPKAYEERFTAENDGIISQLGLDDVVSQAQEAVVDSGLIVTATPTPVPKNFIEEEEEEPLEENIFTQWGIFGGENDKELFSQEQLESFAALTPANIFYDDYWKNNPIISGSQEDYVVFSAHYYWMSFIVWALSYGIVVFIMNMIIRDTARSSANAPYGSYVHYPTVPLKGTPPLPTDGGLVYSSEPPEGWGNYDIYLKSSKNPRPSLDQVLFHQKRKSIRSVSKTKVPKDIADKVAERDQATPSFGLFNIFANVGSPILNEDIGTPEYMELLRRGKEMIPNSNFRMTLLLSSILMLTVWWSCANWIDKNLQALISDPVDKNKGWDQLSYETLKNVNANQGGAIINLLYGSTAILVIISLIWTILSFVWYSKLWMENNSIVEKSANDNKIGAHNEIILGKHLDNVLERNRYYKDAQGGDHHDSIGDLHELFTNSDVKSINALKKILRLVYDNKADFEAAMKTVDEEDMGNMYLKIINDKLKQHINNDKEGKLYNLLQDMIGTDKLYQLPHGDFNAYLNAESFNLKVRTFATSVAGENLDVSPGARDKLKAAGTAVIAASKIKALAGQATALPVDPALPLAHN